MSWRSLWDSMVYYVRGLYVRVDESHLFLMAGGLAFSVFVCIIPFVLVIFFVLGTVLASTSLEQQVNLFVDAVIPYETYAEFVKGALLSRAREIITYKSVYGIVGVLGLLFAASGLFSSMRTILNVIFKVTRFKNEAIGKLRDFGMVFLVLCLFLVSVTLFPVLEAIKDTRSFPFVFGTLSFGLLAQYVYAISSFLIMSAIFYALYFFIPYDRLNWRVLMVSSFWSAVLWEFAEQGFGFYITHFASMQQIYGAYALLVVVAFWIYYACITFVLGAEMGQLYREKRAINN